MGKDQICDDLELSGMSHTGTLNLPNSRPTTPASRGTPNMVSPTAVTDGRGSYLAPGTQENYEEVDDEPMQYEPVDDVPTQDKVGKGTAMVLVARHVGSSHRPLLNDAHSQPPARAPMLYPAYATLPPHRCTEPTHAASVA